jgi:TRAP transporter TAXI family solute receptor
MRTKRLLVAAALAFTASGAGAQQKTTRISIATGGTGGVYYPLGGGLANILTSALPGVEATAEVTSGSVDNMRLIAARKADLAFSLADTAADAFNGTGKFKEKVPVRAIAVVYANKSQWVTIEGTGIAKMQDLKGRRISTGAAGSGTETIAVRMLEALGMNPDKDVKREKLSVAESASALKDRKIEAFFWSGGVPTAAVTDLAATPGVKMRLLDHAEVIPALVKKYGPLYVEGNIPAKSYPGQEKDVRVADVWNVLVVHEQADPKLVYDLVKTLFEKKADLVAVHSEAQNLDLAKQYAGGSPIPFHPGAARYFAEKGLKPPQGGAGSGR